MTPYISNREVQIRQGGEPVSIEKQYILQPVQAVHLVDIKREDNKD